MCHHQASENFILVQSNSKMAGTFFFHTLHFPGTVLKTTMYPCPQVYHSTKPTMCKPSLTQWRWSNRGPGAVPLNCRPGSCPSLLGGSVPSSARPARFSQGPAMIWHPAKSKHPHDSLLSRSKIISGCSCYFCICDKKANDLYALKIVQCLSSNIPKFVWDGRGGAFPSVTLPKREANSG